jgi:lipopolysaccharide O-acetyltransferase
MKIIKYLNENGWYAFTIKLKDIFLSILLSPSKGVKLYFPNNIRGGKFIKFGKNVVLGRYIRIDAFPTESKSFSLVIEDDVTINDNVHLGAYKSVKIGKGTLIASKVFITDHNHGHFTAPLEPNEMLIKPCDREIEADEVVIGQNVWIGENVVVLPGVVIGDNSIVGASSVVTKNIPKDSIAVGSPAKVIKRHDRSLNKWVGINE